MLVLPASFTKVPEGQGVQLVELGALEKEPGGQRAQPTLPAVALALPGGHGAHASAALPPPPGSASPAKPGEHSSQPVPSGVEKDPGAHPAQAAETVCPVREPGKQGIHAPAELPPSSGW